MTTSRSLARLFRRSPTARNTFETVYKNLPQAVRKSLEKSAGPKAFRLVLAYVTLSLSSQDRTAIEQAWGATSLAAFTFLHRQGLLTPSKVNKYCFNAFYFATLNAAVEREKVFNVCRRAIEKEFLSSPSKTKEHATSFSTLSTAAENFFQRYPKLKQRIVALRDTPLKVYIGAYLAAYHQITGSFPSALKVLEFQLRSAEKPSSPTNSSFFSQTSSDNADEVANLSRVITDTYVELKL